MKPRILRLSLALLWGGAALLAAAIELQETDPAQ